MTKQQLAAAAFRAIAAIEQADAKKTIEDDAEKSACCGAYATISIDDSALVCRHCYSDFVPMGEAS
jgi:hypothetical protein